MFNTEPCPMCFVLELFLFVFVPSVTTDLSVLCSLFVVKISVIIVMSFPKPEFTETRVNRSKHSDKNLALTHLRKGTLNF